MKNSILILCLCFLSSFTFAQKDSTFFFDEFSVSLNQSIAQDTSYTNKIGFGLGAYVTILPNKRINILFGFEYNQSSQFQGRIYNGHFSHTTDMSYLIHSLSIPLSARINIGKRVKFFLEPGVYADLNVSVRRKGIVHTYVPDNNNQVIYKTFEIDEKTGAAGATPGISFGIGVKIPISKFQLIVKPDVKFALKPLYDSQNQMNNSYFRISVGLKI